MGVLLEMPLLSALIQALHRGFPVRILKRPFEGSLFLPTEEQSPPLLESGHAQSHALL
jgi:hypothetical protein